MKTQHIIVAIQQTPLCSKVDRVQLINILQVEIARTAVRGGTTMSENDLRFTCEEIAQLIYDDFGTIHIGELPIILRAGVYGKFGESFGVNAVSVNKWIIGYIDSDCRKKAIQEIHRISAERQLPAKAPITPQSEYASIRKMLGESYDGYLRGEEIYDLGCCRYKFLAQLGILKPCSKFKPYIDRKGKVEKGEYELPTECERVSDITSLFDKLRVAGQHILDIVPEQMVEGYWIMFPGYKSN